MTPIHELLNRIRWDKDFGSGQFEIGYLDRHEGTIQRVRLEEVVFPEGERRVFEMSDETGRVRRISFSPRPGGLARWGGHLEAPNAIPPKGRCRDWWARSN